MVDFPDMRGRDAETLSVLFRYFGEVETPRLDSRVYTEFSLGIADDPDLLELAAEVKVGQPPPNVLYAAVQDLLFQARDRPPLADFYPAITREAIPDRPAFPDFRAFCLEHADRLKPILRTGRTQTCVVHRCGVILPGLAALPRSAEFDGRLALLEIGPSAGLNLRLDQYRYDYGGGIGWGAEDAEPLIRVESRGVTPPPMPGRLEIVARRGLDLNRIDTRDPDDVRWLRALIWPEHVERARAMDAALKHAERVPIEIAEGDATHELEDQIARLPPDAARILFATHVFYQIPEDGRERVMEGIARASREAAIDLLLMDSTGEGDSYLDAFAFEGGTRVSRRRLARSDSHGRWIAWGAE